MVYDRFFKNLISEYFKDDFEIFNEFSIGKAPIKIDLIIKIKNLENMRLSIPILSKNLSYINIFEYKSSHDTPQIYDLDKLIGYLGLYLEQTRISIEDASNVCTLWYISSKTPNFLSNLIKNGTIIKTEELGLYRLNIPFPCKYFILIINEIEILENNIPLLLLTSGESFRNTLRMIINKKIKLNEVLEKYLSLAIYINYEEVKEMSEVESIVSEKVLRNIKLAIEDIGIKKVIDIVRVEKVIEQIDIEKLVEQVGIEKLVKQIGIEKLEETINKIKQKNHY